VDNVSIPNEPENTGSWDWMRCRAFPIELLYFFPKQPDEEDDLKAAVIHPEVWSNLVNLKLHHRWLNIIVSVGLFVENSTVLTVNARIHLFQNHEHFWITGQPNKVWRSFIMMRSPVPKILQHGLAEYTVRYILASY
jgi:hypothetical protein